MFLSSTHFLIVRREQTNNNLQVCSFRPRRVLSKVIPPPKPPRVVATYLLPSLASSAFLSRPIGVRCEPTPVYIPPQFEVEGTPEGDDKSDSDPRSGPSVKDASNVASSSSTSSSAKETAHSRSDPFPMNGPVIRPNEDAFRLVVLTLNVATGHSRQSYTMFVAITDLFRRAQEHERIHQNQVRRNSGDTPSPLIPLVVPWNEWGPQSSRVMEGSNSGAWVCYVYMHRFVYQTTISPHFVGPPNELHDPRQMSAIHVLDFNPNVMRTNSPPYRDVPYPSPEEQHRWSRQRARVGFATPVEDSNVFPEDEEYGSPSECVIIDQPTCIPANLFREELMTSLPLRRTTSTLPFSGYRSPMIDAERIILIDVSIGIVIF